MCTFLRNRELRIRGHLNQLQFGGIILHTRLEGCIAISWKKWMGRQCWQHARVWLKSRGLSHNRLVVATPACKMAA